MYSRHTWRWWSQLSTRLAQNCVHVVEPDQPLVELNEALTLKTPYEPRNRFRSRPDQRCQIQPLNRKLDNMITCLIPIAQTLVKYE